MLLATRRRGHYVRGEGARQSILAAIRGNPGLSRSEILRRTGLSWGSVAHHIASMLELGWIRSVTIGRRSYYHAEERTMALFPAMRLIRHEDSACELLRALNRDGAFTVAELSRRLRRSPKTVRRQLQSLAGTGMVARAPKLGMRFELRSVPLEMRSSLVGPDRHESPASPHRGPGAEE